MSGHSSLKRSLCPAANQFNFTFQEWSSVLAAELGQRGPRGIKERGHRHSPSSESVFGREPARLLPHRTNHVPQGFVTPSIANLLVFFKKVAASSKYDAVLRHAVFPVGRKLHIKPQLLLKDIKKRHLRGNLAQREQIRTYKTFSFSHYSKDKGYKPNPQHGPEHDYCSVPPMHEIPQLSNSAKAFLAVRGSNRPVCTRP